LEGKQLTFPHVLYATKRDVNLTDIERRKRKNRLKEERTEGRLDQAKG
jgi:hypothetical protein